MFLNKLGVTVQNQTLVTDIKLRLLEVKYRQTIPSHSDLGGRSSNLSLGKVMPKRPVPS
jgi:hypothetical protein